MHSFEVHSNESAYIKKVRLGLEQVIVDLAYEWYRVLVLVVPLVWVHMYVLDTPEVWSTSYKIILSSS